MKCLCGLDYHDFRTGLTFGAVRRMMWSEGPPETWRHKRRGSVLGYWRQIKLAMWADHNAECRHWEAMDPEGFAEWHKQA